jgi:beta-aspartyl-peptidase (threonine type)
MPRKMDAERIRRYEEGLREALEIGRSMLEDGAGALDVVERVIAYLEDHPQFNAGKGAVFNADGRFELDASIMDGRTGACGAVAGVGTVKNPIALSRKIMEETEHILLGGAGAERFAVESGMEQVVQEYFWTERRRRQWEEYLRENGNDEGAARGTVGAVVLDRHGDLAAGTSTGGLLGKMPGRIGDSPILGAGTWAGNGTCAVSCTGKGEEFIRHAVAHAVAAGMARGGASLEDSARHAVHDLLEPGTGGLIAVGGDGTIVMTYNTGGMLRAAADSTGRFEIAIWD